MTSVERAFRKWFREIGGKTEQLDREECRMAFHAGWHLSQTEGYRECLSTRDTRTDGATTKAAR